MGYRWVGSIIFPNDGADGPFELMGLRSHKEIMETQCDLLTSNFKDSEATFLAMKENIERIQQSEGSLSHCADSLNLGLRKAFELKKQRRSPPGVKLRCAAYSSCQIYNTTISCSSAQSHGTCPYCNHWLHCAGCGTQRNGNYASCGSCRKKFI